MSTSEECDVPITDASADLRFHTRLWPFHLIVSIRECGLAVVPR